jgi:hypothetical protein
MPFYDIQVVVQYNYSRYADSREEAEEEAKNFADFGMSSDVVEVSIIEQEPIVEDEDDNLSVFSDTIQESNPN